MTPSQTSRRSRTPLSRERAIEAAVALADREGIGAVTMRRLARELGVEAMSLYHHVANKDEILDGMVDLVFAGIPLPEDEPDWKIAMRERAESVRSALLQHRWAIGLTESRAHPGPATLRHHDWVIGCCRRAGFSVRMTAHAYSLLDSYIFGFVLQEVNLPFSDDQDLEPIVDEMMAPFAMDEYPHLRELTVDAVLQQGYSYESEFGFGLGLVLDALEPLRGT